MTHELEVPKGKEEANRRRRQETYIKQLTDQRQG